MTWKAVWVFIFLFVNCLYAAPDKYYSYDVLEKAAGSQSYFIYPNTF